MPTMLAGGRIKNHGIRYPDNHCRCLTTQGEPFDTRMQFSSQGNQMSVHASNRRPNALWRWVVFAMALFHSSAEAMTVADYEQELSGSGRGLIFGMGVMAAVFVELTYPELLAKYAPNLNSLLKWCFRVGVALIVLELILSKFGVLAETREPGSTLLWLWSIGRMGMVLYLSGIADSREK